MSPDLLALSRQLAALPGFTVSKPADFALYHQQGATYFRDARDLRWVNVAGEDAGAYEWLPDLTDDATGGVLLGLLPPSLTIERDPGIVTVFAFTGGTTRTSSGATLPEACARILVALGRCA